MVGKDSWQHLKKTPVKASRAMEGLLVKAMSQLNHKNEEHLVSILDWTKSKG